MSPEAAKDHAELRSIGWVPGEDSRHVLAAIDPTDEDPPIDVRRHPRLLLLEDRELWGVVDRYSTGARRRLRASDYSRLSSWETVAVMTMRAATMRERAREAKRMAEKEESDDARR